MRWENQLPMVAWAERNIREMWSLMASCSTRVRLEISSVGAFGGCAGVQVFEKL